MAAMQHETKLIRRIAQSMTGAVLLAGWLPSDLHSQLALADTEAAGTRTYSFWGDVGKAELSDTQPIEVGVKFRTDVDGEISAVRFYRHVPIDSGYKVHIWNATGKLLGTGVSYEGQQPTPGWQIVEVYPPVPIKARKIYVASYYASTGRYAVTENFFTNATIRNGPLLGLKNSRTTGGNGVYVYGPGDGFPTEAFRAGNYWVDVVFTKVSGFKRPLDIHIII